MKSNNFLLNFVAVYFGIKAVFHFIRLATNWDIIFGSYFLPHWASALYILFSIAIILWITKIKKKSKGEQTKKDKEDHVEDEYVNDKLEEGNS